MHRIHHHQIRHLLLKAKIIEPQGAAILGDGPHGFLGHAAWYMRLNLKRHLHISTIERRQVLDHLLHDFPGVSGHYAWVDFHRAVEAAQLFFLG